MRNDLTGRKYGTLVVVGVAGRDRRGMLWLVRCRCGVEKAVRADKLVAGVARSCGAAGCKAVARAIKVIGDDFLLSDDDRREISDSIKVRR